MITNWTADGKQFSLLFEENPLADFVELPDDDRAQDELWFSNILCGVLRGALEMVCQALILHCLMLRYAYMDRSKCPSKHTSLVTFYVGMRRLRCELL